MMLILFISLLLPQVVVPELELKDTSGVIHRLSDYRGKIVLLNFWATWCVPCRNEMPLLNELHGPYSARGVQFIAVSIDDETTAGDIPAFLKKYRVEMPVWTGATPDQQAAFKLATAVPATLLIDGDGMPKFRIIGEAHRDMIVERLEWLLSDRSAAMPSDLVLPPSITPEHFAEHEAGLEDEHEEEDAGSEVPS